MKKSSGNGRLKCRSRKESLSDQEKKKEGIQVGWYVQLKGLSSGKGERARMGQDSSSRAAQSFVFASGRPAVRVILGGATLTLQPAALGIC